MRNEDGAARRFRGRGFRAAWLFARHIEMPLVTGRDIWYQGNV